MKIVFSLVLQSSVSHMAVYKFLAFKGLYIQTNLRNKFLKKLYKTMNVDHHTQASHIHTMSIT